MSAGDLRRFDTACLTHAGARRVNEDRADWAQSGDCGCWVLADGLGGHCFGEVAAEVAVSSLLHQFRAQPQMRPDALQDLLTAAQTALHQRQQQQPSCATMRTTLVVLLADARQAYWAHVGDSRLYLFRNGQVLAQTRDHSIAQSLVTLGELDAAALRHDPDRSRLLRDLGAAGPVRGTVTTTPLPLQAGDVFLLCSDGFWEPVLETAMLAALTPTRTMAAWLDDLAGQIVQLADPAQDNYTAVAVRVA